MYIIIIYKNVYYYIINPKFNFSTIIYEMRKKRRNAKYLVSMRSTNFIRNNF